MERVAKNLIIAVLIGVAMLVAGLSAASDGRANCTNYHEIETKMNDTVNYEERDSEFWSKFRESVMPDDSDKKGKGKVPNYEKPPSEPAPERHQPPPPRH